MVALLVIAAEKTQMMVLNRQQGARLGARVQVRQQLTGVIVRVVRKMPRLLSCGRLHGYELGSDWAEVEAILAGLGLSLRHGSLIDSRDSVVLWR